MDFYNPQDFGGLLQTQGQVGGNAAQSGLAFGAPVRSTGQGKQSALQQLALMRIMQSEMRHKLSQDAMSDIQKEQMKSQDAGPFDFLGAGIGALEGVNGMMNRDEAYRKLGMQRKNVFQQIFG